MIRVIKLFILFFLLSINSSLADCNFKTSDFINELSNPLNIKSININVPKSANYVQNFIKIITSDDITIPKELKKKFNADIQINYKFGSCEYPAKVRQHGDFKDHVKFNNSGLPVRSLNIKLKQGNILNSVSFKLLIPETRNSENEILASELFKFFSLLSPETFKINTKINGAEHIMLFQEGIEKEFLEKNNRREGPLFKGDEDLMWGYKNYPNELLDTISFSKMINTNWFEKGNSSQFISLNSFSRLQSSYLNQRMLILNNIVKKNFPFNPDFSKPLSQNFKIYLSLIYAMAADHALIPNNNRFYYNAIIDEFEPIYYDGNVKFLNIDNYYDRNYLSLLKTNFLDDKEIEKLIYALNELKHSDSFFENYLNKNLFSHKISKNKYFYSFDLMVKNLTYLLNINVKDEKKINLNKNNEDNLKFYDNFLKKINYFQREIYNIEKIESNFYAEFRSGKSKLYSTKDISNLLRNNEIDGQRTIFIKKKTLPNEYNSSQLKIYNFSLGDIVTSKNMIVEISELTKNIKFKQLKKNDWALLKSLDLTDWSIDFIGVPHQNNDSLIANQRFNEFGLTGCLNIYDSILKMKSLFIKDGYCEDSINIIRSSDNINQIVIENSYADAIDLDFSEVSVDMININQAGNDCIDLSSGVYFFNQINISNCKDKGISVGEKSIFKNKNVNISNSSIGISSKDSSKVFLNDGFINNTKLCYEVFQKKQEFGGAFMNTKHLDCTGDIFVDVNSSLIAN